MEDISEKVRQFRAKQMTNFKNKLMNSMSHNLKTPLNGILMLANGGEYEKNENKKNEYFEDI